MSDGLPDGEGLAGDSVPPAPRDVKDVPRLQQDGVGRGGTEAGQQGRRVGLQALEVYPAVH